MTENKALRGTCRPNNIPKLSVPFVRAKQHKGKKFLRGADHEGSQCHPQTCVRVIDGSIPTSLKLCLLLQSCQVSFRRGVGGGPPVGHFRNQLQR